MASDFSIAQFRFLERLLVVHGHWCYKRIAQMVKFTSISLFFFMFKSSFDSKKPRVNQPVMKIVLRELSSSIF